MARKICRTLHAYRYQSNDNTGILTRMKLCLRGCVRMGVSFCNACDYSWFNISCGSQGSTKRIWFKLLFDSNGYACFFVSVCASLCLLSRSIHRFLIHVIWLSLSFSLSPPLSLCFSALTLALALILSHRFVNICILCRRDIFHYYKFSHCCYLLWVWLVDYMHYQFTLGRKPYSSRVLCRQWLSAKRSENASSLLNVPTPY